MSFAKAQRREIPIKIALIGPSGSGKTYSALQLAFGLGKKIGLLDTENRSASYYADLGEFDCQEIDPPYTANKYETGIDEAIKEKYDVLIIDSLSHLWAGQGGLLEMKDKLDAAGGNSFANWNKMTPILNSVIAKILNSRIHVICTMRSKQQYVLSENDKGKFVPTKMGMAPQMRDGVEYEFGILLELGMTHMAIAGKDRTGLFSSAEQFQITKESGERILAWANTGVGLSEELKIPEKLEEKLGLVAFSEIQIRKIVEKYKSNWDEIESQLDSYIEKKQEAAKSFDKQMESEGLKVEEEEKLFEGVK